MPLRCRKRKNFASKDAETLQNDSEERPSSSSQQGKAFNTQRKVVGNHKIIDAAGGQANKEEIFAVGRFHDLGLAPTLSDHIHSKPHLTSPHFQINHSNTEPQFRIPESAQNH